jgi:hypothetical protein
MGGAAPRVRGAEWLELLADAGLCGTAKAMLGISIEMRGMKAVCGCGCRGLLSGKMLFSVCYALLVEDNPWIR